MHAAGRARFLPELLTQCQHCGTMQSLTKCQFVFSLHSGAVCAAVRIELLGKESLLMQHKILIAYFSASGVTAGVAREMAQAVGADLYEIRPAAPYTPADLDWRNRQSRSSREMGDPACRPALAPPAVDLAQYDTILLGFPIWWYVGPRIVDTFLESQDFSGKTVIPFATSGGSGIEKAARSLKDHCPDAVWKPGRLLHRAGAAEWAKAALAQNAQD